jgi:hypothetical protein
MTTDSLEWAALALGTAGAELSEVTPPELVALLGEWGARFGRATDRAQVTEQVDRPGPPVRA